MIIPIAVVGMFLYFAIGMFIVCCSDEAMNLDLEDGLIVFFSIVWPVYLFIILVLWLANFMFFLKRMPFAQWGFKLGRIIRRKWRWRE